MSGPIVRWLRRHDPEWYALHKAIKVAFAVTLGLAIGTWSGNSQLSLFASFGGVALLLFADFPGGRSARLGAYVGLAVIGAVLITLGTLMSGTAWLAVLGMAVFGFTVMFAGVLSAAAAGATRAALLAFILPVTIPATAAEIGSRLAGWGLSVLIAVPLAILVWPPRDNDKLRECASRACAALASQLAAATAEAAGTGAAAQDASTVDASPVNAGTVDAGPVDASPVNAGPVDASPVGGAGDAPPSSEPATTGTATADEVTQQAIIALRRQFRSTTYRPVGLTTGSRLLMTLVDRLEWLRAVVDRVPAGTADRWPARYVDLVTACGEVLQAGAEVLAHPAHRPSYAARQRLAAALRALDQHRARVASFVLAVDGPPGGRVDPAQLRPAVGHELVYTTHLVGNTIAVSAAADARPLIDRLLGRQAPSSVDGSIAAAHRIMAGHITRGSVWFQNSLRGALGLAIAVFLAEVTEIAHGFWVVLGAMSVLRTTALTTGSTAVRALSGTLVGFAVGAGIILLAGVTPWHLWVLLPFSVLIAAYLPEAVSFVAGQAAFTVMVVILFNIIQPVGWTVGLIRIEDIALGCAAGLISGVLLWPHGAAAQIRSALSDYYRRSADLLEAAGRLATAPFSAAAAGAEPAAPEPDTLEQVEGRARAAGLRLDDALREYLFERGTKALPVSELTAMTNGVNRVRLAAEAIAGMTNRVRSEKPAQGPAAAAVSEARTGLTGSASASAGWFRTVADVIDQPTLAVPTAVPVTAQQRVLQAFRADPDSLRNVDIATAGTALWSASLYVDDVTRLQDRLSDHVRTLNAPPAPGAPDADDTVAAPGGGRSPVGSSR